MTFILDSKITSDEKESVVLGKANGLISTNQFDLLYDFLTSLESKIWPGLSSPRYSKILKKILNMINPTENTYRDIQKLIESLIEFDSRNLIKLDLGCKLVFLHLMAHSNEECIRQANKLIPQLKRLDDKINLIWLFLYESKANYETHNLPSARASLTAAKALAVCAATPHELQAEIDLLNGMYLIEDKLYETAINYLLEVFHNVKKITALRYIILCKILKGEARDVRSYLNKSMSQITPEDLKDHLVVTLLEIADACEDKDIIRYREIIQNKDLFSQDCFLRKPLELFFDQLLTQNILKIIRPYNRIRIDFIATQLLFNRELIEEKLRLMILDKVLFGILDHESQSLILFEHLEKKKDNLTEVLEESIQFFGKIQ